MKKIKTQKQRKAQRKRHKKYLRKHPDKIIKSLKEWISREKNPEQLERAKGILKRHTPA